MQKKNNKADSRAEILSGLKKLDNKKACPAAQPNISAAASATECTGLIPTMPENDDEYAQYQELSSTEIPKRNKD